MQIDTARLRLRPFELQDLDDFATLLADPGFMAFSIGGPLTPSRARDRLLALRACYEAHGFSKWAIRMKRTPALVGYCGLETEVLDGEEVPELGFRIGPAFQGRGFATEAARGVVQDAFARLRLPCIYAFVEPANIASRRVLAKLGMSEQRECVLKGRNYILLRLDRPS